MKQFLKFMFASFFGFILATIILLFLLIGMVASLSKETNNEVTIKENSVLELKLNYQIPERTQRSPFGDLLPWGGESKILGLNDILQTIEKAGNDPNIKGILLHVNLSSNNYATLESVRTALRQFKKQGKFIYAYGEYMDEHGYYVAAMADRIFLNPSGELLLNGFTTQIIYMKGLFEKLGIKPELIRHGKYKSAGESLVADKMSAENREQIESYMGSLYQHFINNIAKDRHKKPEEVREIIHQLKIQNAQNALELKMVDQLAYTDELEKALRKKLSLDAEQEVNKVSMQKMKQTKGNVSASSNKIAVLYCNGDIVNGEGDDESMGSDRIAEAIKKIRNDKSYKALVLRINSPGGSAQASDVIWREVMLCKKEKPVVVSMGDVAASGGYYIAAPASYIVAQPNTITGSIGVFGVLINAGELIQQKLGLKIETVKTAEFADLGSPDRALSAAERQIIQNSIDRIYTVFLDRVASGRKMKTEYVDSIAQGRVWSGAEAKQIGLVDDLGGLDKAIEIAAEKAKLDEYRTVELPELKDPLEEIFANMEMQAKTFLIKQELGTLYPEYLQAKKALQWQGIQTRMDYELLVE